MSKFFLEILEKLSADKIQSKEDKAIRLVLMQTGGFYRDLVRQSL